MLKNNTLCLLFSFFSIACFSQSLQDSLKAYFKFDGTVLDATSNNEDLKNPTSPDYRVVNGTDSAFYFNGNERLEGVSSYDNSSYNEIAISLWFKTGTINNTRQLILQGANMGFAVLIEPTTGKVSAFFDSNSSGRIIGNNNLADNVWHHLVAQNNGNITYLYVDGSLVASKTDQLYTGNGSSNNKLYFGKTNLNLDSFTGSINNVRIYNRILSKCEINELSGNHSLDKNLKAHFTFDGNVLDETSNNEDLKAPTNPDYRVVNATDSAYYFDGNTRLESNSSFDNSTYSETALSLWIKTASDSKALTVISGAYIGFAIFTDTAGHVFASFDGSSAGSIKSNNDLTDDVWHHIFAQNDGNTTELYIDGIYESSLSESLYNGTGGSNNIIYFGDNRLNTFPYNGLLNEVRIYDRVLGDCEIDSLYQLNNNTTLDCDALYSHQVDSTNTVHFIANSNSINNTYSWNFGDNNSDTVANPSHSYASSGSYIVTLTVINANGDTCSTSDSIFVNTCSSDFTYSIGSGGLVSFINNSISANLGTSFSWDFGDSSTSSIKDPTHIYDSSGTYTVTLTINDSLNNCSSSWSANVIIVLSSSNCNASFTIAKDSSIQYNIILYNTSTNATTHTYTWDFGDGTTGSGRTPIHTYQNFGLFEVCLTITDSILNCDTITFCDTVGMDSLGNLKAGFGIEVRDPIIVGVEENDDPFSSLRIFPNPTNGIVRFQIDNSESITSVRVMNTSGQIIFIEENIQGRENTLYINGPNGLYFIEITDIQGNISISKIIKN